MADYSFSQPYQGWQDPSRYTITSAQTGGGMDPITGAVMGGSALMGLFGGLFSDGPTDTRPSLTPEMELQMMDYFQSSLANINDMMTQNQQMMSLLNERMDVARGAMAGTIPSADALERLTQTSMKIAQAFGGDALAAVKNGFLDEQTAKISGLLQEREGQLYNSTQEELASLRKMEGQDFVDPNVENQIQEQRRQLEQNLARSGVSPAQRAIALREFENSANAMRFSTSQELKTSATQRALARISTGQSGLQTSTGALTGAGQIYLAGRQNRFNEAIGGYNASMGMLQYGQQGIMNQANLALTQQQAGLQSIGVQRQLNADPMSFFQQVGTFKRSDTLNRASEAGLVGPGTTYAQTGVSRNVMQDYKDWVRGQENAATRQGGGQVSYSPQQYASSGQANLDAASAYRQWYQRQLVSGSVIAPPDSLYTRGA